MPTQPPPDQAPRFCALSEIAPRLVDWLWPARLALGQLATLDGDPGLCKSFLALDLCARLSTGRGWPDGAPAAGPAAAVFLNGEDSAEQTIAPRLRALGGDPARVFVLDRGNRDFAASFSLPAQIGPLEEVVDRTEARLVVIDPVLAFFGPGVNTASYGSMRRALEPLADLAERYACTILLIRHLNKTAGLRALYRGLASIGLVGTCRSAWLVAEGLSGPSRRVLAQLKNNGGPPQPSLAFEVTQLEGAPPTLTWLGPVAVTADGLLARGRRHGPDPQALETAKAFLTELLAGGPLRHTEVWERAQAAGLSKGTLRRAKEEIPVRSIRMKEDGRFVSYWALSHQQSPAALPPDDDETSLEPWLAPLRAKYPAACPLDDDD